MQNNRSKISELFRNPFFIIGVITAVILIAIVAFLFFNHKNQPSTSETTYEYDPASEEYIANIPPTGGGDSDSNITYVGTAKLFNYGITTRQFDVVKDALKDFSLQNKFAIYRVSFVKDSIDVPRSYVYNFNLMLNIDQKLIKVTVDSSAGYKTILGLKIFFYDESDQEIYHYIVDDSLACDKYNICDSSD